MVVLFSHPRSLPSFSLSVPSLEQVVFDFEEVKNLADRVVHDVIQGFWLAREPRNRRKEDRAYFRSLKHELGYAPGWSGVSSLLPGRAFSVRGGSPNVCGTDHQVFVVGMGHGGEGFQGPDR